jgi:neutral ceramidase
VIGRRGSRALRAIAALGLAMAGAGGCTSLAVEPPLLSAPLRPTGAWRAGAAKVDLTPMPGFPMGGHSRAGQTARGYWTRLHANAIYIEEPHGRRLALVSCDLWSMPAGLADRVAELVASDDRGRRLAPERVVLSRDQIVLAATHTHQSPGNFSTASGYNTFASPHTGFDPRLFEFLAQRISAAILTAARSARPAVLTYAAGPVARLARNRSFSPFLQNALEAPAVMAEYAGLPAEPVPPVYPEPPPPYGPGAIYRAVTPRLRVLSMHVPGDPADVIATAAFVAVHPTSLSNRTPLYTSDFFGVASILAEQALRRETRSRSPVVAIFNGAEGDVSPAWECRPAAGRPGCQQRVDALGLGRILADRIVELGRQGQALTGRLEHRFAHAVRLNGECLREQPSICTAKTPMIGVAMLGGTPDGRSDLYALGWHEGVTGTPTPDQGAKRPALDLPFVPASSPVGLSRFVMTAISIPNRVPLGLYRLGPILLATVPGEFTTVMGLRIERALSRAMADRGRPVEHVILVGLANEYVSYFTTPEEYALQFYEGASTAYGPASGPLVQDRLTLLVEQLDDPPPPHGDAFVYSPGNVARYGLCDVKPDAESREGLAGMLQDGAGQTLPDAPTFCWSDRVPSLRAASRASRRVTPLVSIEARRADGAWAPLPGREGGAENDQGLNFVTTASFAFPGRSRWCATWLGTPPPGVAGELRFHVKTLGGGSRYGPVRRAELPAAAQR